MRHTLVKWNLVNFSGKYYRLLLLACSVWSGCAARYTGYGPFLPVEKTIKRIAILNLRSTVLMSLKVELTEFRVDWSDIAKETCESVDSET